MTRRVTRDRRLTIVAVVLLIGLLAITVKLVVLQSLHAGKYQKLASQQREISIRVASRRGTIFDREGEIMAISEDVTTVYATPYQVKDRKSTARKIAQILGEDPDDIEKKLARDSGFEYLARKIDNNLAEKIEKLKIPGIGFIEESKRFYPMGDLASQVLGVVDMDDNGQAGVELYYDDFLGGEPGEVLLERDANGNPIPGSEKRRSRAVDGVDLQITLDKDIQICLEEALSGAVKRHGARAGTGLVIDCNSGEILAMGSMPSFDPNDRESIETSSMRNRAITDVYEPGSALKVVTAVAALSEGLVSPDTIISVPSQIQVADEVFTDAVPRAACSMPFSQVISRSSNVGTIQVALMLGSGRLSKYLDRLGLGHPTCVDFPGEVDGIVPELSSWSGTSAATICIGQGISLTPLQLACVVAAIANGGRKVYPHFLKARVDDNGFQDMGLGGLGDEILSSEACKSLTGIMEQVTEPGGTGTRAAVNYYRVAGKTGTAAKALQDGPGYSKNYMATFVGFAPAESPRLAVLVVLDEPSPIWGGVVSAPVFKEIMELSLQHLRIPPSWESKR